MRAWAEMFNAFLSGGTRPAPTPRPYTDADYFAHVDGKPRYDGVRDLLDRARHRPARGRPDDPPDADTVCGLGNRKNDAFNVVLERDGVDPYPGSVALLDAPARPADAARGRLVVGERPRGARRRRPGRPVRHRGRRRGSPTELGLPGKPAPDTFVHAATELRRHPGPLGRRRGRRLGRPGRAPPATSGWSSASTAGAGADDADRRPGPTSSSPTSASSSREAARPAHVGRTRSTAAASRSTRGALVETRLRPDDLGVTETLFAVGNGYLGLRGNPEEGRDALRARHLRQRLPRDLADPARRGGLRLRAHRADHRQRARREDDEALRRRRAARHRHRRPRALRAQPRLPRRRAAPHRWSGARPSGKRVRVDSTRMVSMTQRHLAVHDPRGRRCCPATPRSSISSQMLNRQDGERRVPRAGPDAGSRRLDPRKAGAFERAGAAAARCSSPTRTG